MAGLIFSFDEGSLSFKTFGAEVGICEIDFLDPCLLCNLCCNICENYWFSIPSELAGNRTKPLCKRNSTIS